ncbi:MAG: hypothetical protein ACFFDN_10825 [Candidatus Hodarchaeota archaeon]
MSRDWLYGKDIIDELIQRHPEWEFVRVDGSQKNIYENIDVYLRPNRHDGIAKMVKEAKYNNIPTIWSYETGEYVEPSLINIERRLIEITKS